MDKATTTETTVNEYNVDWKQASLDKRLYLTELTVILADCTADTAQLSEQDLLRLVYLTKHVKELLNNVEDTLRKPIGEYFTALTRQEPGKKKFTVYDGLLALQHYVPKSTWVYPEEIVKAELELKRAKDLAKKNNSATKRSSSSETVCAVTLNDK